MNTANMRIAVSFAFLAAGCLQAQTPASRFDTRIRLLKKQSSVIQHSRLGYKFVEMSTGRTLAESDAQTFFTPASNTKLYTTACALERLGANYKLRTELRTSGAWKPGQTRISDLQLIGGGDPNLSGRPLPYQVSAPNTEPEDPLRAMKLLADQVYEAGVREIAGNVSATGQRYPGDSFPDGWTLDDTEYGYGAPISALSVNDNLANLTLRPTTDGELADVEVQPAVGHFVISNQVTTVPGKESHIKLLRPGHSNQVVLTGTIGNAVEQWREELGLDDAELWAAECLTSALRARGISVAGMPIASNGARPGTPILVHESAPLSQLIQVVNKVSQNLHAEMLLREVAVVRTQSGTLENGLKERQAFLTEVGLLPDPPPFAFADGSGLARQDLTTPESTTRLLVYMWSRPQRDAWLQSLPIGGLDGSLQKRFKKIANAQNVHAKTGSLSHVAALSGYIETRSHGWLAFSVMVNGAVGRDAEVRDFLDKLCALFLPI